MRSLNAPNLGKCYAYNARLHLNIFSPKCSDLLKTIYFSLSILFFKATNDLGVGTQTSFMFLTIAIVPILVSTIAFLPKSRIPWPLPATYGNKHMLNGGSGRAKSSRGMFICIQMKMVEYKPRASGLAIHKPMYIYSMVKKI